MSTETRLATRLVQIAMRLHALQPWRTFEDRDAFGLELPDLEQPLAACFCGQSGHEYGLALFRDGIAGLRTVWASSQFDDHGESVDQIGLFVSPLREIAPELRGLLTAARWRGRRETPAPFLLVKRPGKAPRGANRKEMKIALYAAAAALAELEAGTLEANGFDGPEGVPLLRLSGPPQTPHIEHGRLAAPPRDEAVVSSDLKLCSPVHRMCETTWSAGVFTVPGTIRGDDRAVRALLLADVEAGEVLATELVMGEGTQAAAEAVLAYMDGEPPDATPQIPRRIECMNENLAKLLAPALIEHDVDCEYVPHQPALEEMGASLSDYMARSPEPDDPALEPWRDALNRVHELAADAVEARNLSTDRALAAYFRDLEVGRDLLDSDEDDEYTTSFSNWFLAVYRPRKGSATLVESVLKRRGLDKHERIVAKALRNARPSIYRIDDVGETQVTVLDLVSGERDRVDGPEWCIPECRAATVAGILMRTGTHTLLLPVAPILDDFVGADIFEELERNGIEFSPEGLAAAPEFAGLLADWYRSLSEDCEESEGGEFDMLKEIAGELGIAVHKADFRMADPAGALQALEAHEGISRDSKTQEYLWERESEFDRTGLLPDLVARWDVIDDHLVVTCETVEHFEDTRKMLEAIPGVELVDMHTEPFGSRDQGSEEGGVPMDDLTGIDDLSAEPDEELSSENVEGLAQFQRQILHDWLERGSPRLEGLTPREACETDAGTRRVKFLIRTRPIVHPCIPDDLIEELRREAFDELGLDA